MPSLIVDSGTDRPTAAHPIAVVAARTGLTRDVLRVWERRYGAVEPMRSGGGQRLYTDEHVRRFRLLAAATRHGRSIGLVAQLPTEELERLAAEDESASGRVTAAPDSLAGTIDLALAHIVALDGPSLDGQLRRLIAREGLPWFLDRLAPALMRAVGDGWAAGRLSIAHEHLASAAVISIVLDAARAVPIAGAAPRVVVATPAGDRHAVGAAFAAAAAALEGWGVLYLGADLPAADIATAARVANGVRAVALSLVYIEDRDQTLRELRALRDHLNARIPLLLGGEGAAAIAPELHAAGIAICDGLAALRGELSRAH